MQQQPPSEITVIDSDTGKPVEPEPFELTALGMVVHGQPSITEWAAFGRKLFGIRTGLQWAIGDWINYGQSRVDWGEKYDQALAAFDYDYGYLANMSSIAAKFEQSRRTPLSWSHHQAVAALPAPQADELLKLAVASRGVITRDDLRERAKNLLTDGKSRDGNEPKKKRIVLFGLEKVPCSVRNVNFDERFVVIGFENTDEGAAAVKAFGALWQHDEQGLSLTIDQTVIEDGAE